MGALNDYFRRRRLELRMSLPQLAKAAGYQNLAKGCQRIDQFEREGRINSVLLDKLAASLGISPETVEWLLRQDQRQFIREWSRWANEIQPYYLLIRLIPAVYKREMLPEAISTDGEAEDYAATVARHWRRYVCLVLSRRLSVWFDEQGQVYSRTEAAPGLPNEPYMRLHGNKRGFTLGPHSIRLIQHPPQPNHGPDGPQKETE